MSDLEEARTLLCRWVTPERDLSLEDQDSFGLHLHEDTEAFLARRAPGGVVGAQIALADLRTAMATIRDNHPAYAPGTGPSAADNCAQVLDMLNHGLTMVRTYLGG